MIPEPDLDLLNPDIQTAVSRMQAVVELGRTARERRRVGTKMPIQGMTLQCKDEGFIRDLKTLEVYVKEELNSETVEYSASDGNVSLVATPNFKTLGKKVGKDMKAIQEA